jgi:hypothetical protein
MDRARASIEASPSRVIILIVMVIWIKLGCWESTYYEEGTAVGQTAFPKIFNKGKIL